MATGERPQSMSWPKGYRTDIDGLRAMAILPVVAYHLDLLSGGLIGVDVFFVISGYLITSLLSADLDAGRYSIWRFYERRARRIFPALFAMMIATSIAILMVALPAEIETYHESLAAAVLFASNIYFYFTQDYFAGPALSHPLLHTWSLAVEEQFYIVFPLLLWFLRRNAGRAERWVLAVLLVASFAWSCVLVQREPSAAFYLPLSRAWELLLGALLAVGRIPPFRGAWMPEASSAIGFAAIVASAALLDSDTPFPGIAAVPACLGAALIIHSGAGRLTMVGRLLSLWPVRLVGLISYSWYLWHWALISLTSYLYGVDMESPFVRIALFIGSAAIAWLSWRYIEAPFRGHADPRKTAKIFFASAVAMVALLVLAVSLPSIGAVRWNVTPEVSRVLALLNYDLQRPLRVGQCFMPPDKGLLDFDQAACLNIEPGKKNYLLIGDSHAAHLWAGLEKYDPSINVLQATSSRCLPTLQGKGGDRCRELRDFIFTKFLPAHHLDGIILNGRWTRRSIPLAIETAQALKPYADRIVIYGPIVEYKRPLPRTLALSMLRDAPEIVDQDRETDPAEIDHQLSKAAAEAGVAYFSVYDAICPDSKCILFDADGLPLQFDYGHLTVSGAELVARKAREASMY